MPPGAAHALVRVAAVIPAVLLVLFIGLLWRHRTRGSPGPGSLPCPARAAPWRGWRSSPSRPALSTAARSASAWVSSDCRTVDARAYPIRTCPDGSAPAVTGRGSSVQGDPGRRSGGTGTLRAFARCGTSRNRAVWYWTATLPRLIRHGDPAGAAQDDIGQSRASTRSRAPSDSSLTDTS